MDPLVSTWTIDYIRSDSWEREGNRAYIEASNFAGDACSYELILNPLGDAVVLNFEISMFTDSWYEKTLGKTLEELVVPDAERALQNWNKETQRIAKKLPKGQWKKGPGNTYDLEYALLSLLYEKLSEFGGLKTTSRISQLLNIELSTAKERMRECRNRDFLTASSKGVRGSSKITQKARKQLIKEGVIDAKKGK
jgi:hypothetical protein